MRIKICGAALLSFFVTFKMGSSSESVQVIRDFTKDSLYCPNDVKCSEYDADQTAPNECDCVGGSFVRDENLMKCKKNVQSYKECIFHFKNSADKFPAISIYSTLAGDFLEPVVSKTTDCPKMALSSVDYFDAGFQTWMPFSKLVFTIIRSSSGTTTIRWINPFTVDTDLFGGQLVKFNLNCETTTNEKDVNKNSLCVIGKIIGARNFSDHSGICKQQDTSVINNVNKTRENETDIVPMIGAIIAVVFVVFLIVLIVCFCRKRKYKKKKRTRERATSLSEVKLKSTSDYAEPCEIGFSPPPDSPTNFENKSYMTALRGNHNISNTNNNNKNYVNFPSQQPNGGVKVEGGENSTVKPFLSSNNDYEQILYDDPNSNNGGGSVENYELLPQSNIPTYHTLNIQSNTDNELYEDLSPKLGTV